MGEAATFNVAVGVSVPVTHPINSREGNLMKTSEFISNTQALLNELRAAMEMTTPETYNVERDKVLAKFGMQEYLDDLTHG